MSLEDTSNIRFTPNLKNGANDFLEMKSNSVGNRTTFNLTTEESYPRVYSTGETIKKKKIKETLTEMDKILVKCS